MKYICTKDYTFNEFLDIKFKQGEILEINYEGDEIGLGNGYCYKSYSFGYEIPEEFVEVSEYRNNRINEILDI